MCKYILNVRGGILVVIFLLGIWIYIYSIVESQVEYSTTSIAQSIHPKFTPVREDEITEINGVPGIYLKKCNCTKHKGYSRSREEFKSSLVSTCSEEADWYGIGQRIVSYTFYSHIVMEDKNDIFTLFDGGILPNLEEMRKLYPGWIMRLYSNFDLNVEYCHYACMDDVMWCDVRQPRFNELENVNPRLWRFMPLGDPTVDIFVSRDLDSLITEREREVVEEWEHSSFSIHCARDGHKFHRPMSAGAWGAKNYDLGINLSKSLRQKMLTRGYNNTDPNLDEDLLQELIFHGYSDFILVHDSYSCMKHLQVPSAPFPKQRKNRFTQFTLEIVILKTFRAPPCPVECRPSYGKNWTYC